MKAFDQFMLSLALRMFASWKSTFLGVALALGADFLGRLAVDPAMSPYVHTLAVLISVPFLAYRDRHISDGSAVRVNLPGVTLAIAFFFLFPFGAHAQTPGARAAAASVGTLADVAPSDAAPAPVAAPLLGTIGGCFGKAGAWCIAPTVAVSLAAINLSQKKIEPSFSPGLGLGVIWNKGQWYSLGAAGYINADSGTQNFSAAGAFSILNGWGRVGYSKGFIGDTSSRIFFGIGIL